MVFPVIFWPDESYKSTGARNITAAMRRDIIEIVKENVSIAEDG